MRFPVGVTVNATSTDPPETFTSPPAGSDRRQWLSLALQRYPVRFRSPRMMFGRFDRVESDPMVVAHQPLAVSPVATKRTGWVGAQKGTNSIDVVKPVSPIGKVLP